MQTWLVTGGAGFLGASLVRLVRSRDLARVVTFDALTYAGDLARVAALEGDTGQRFVEGDIADAALVGALLEEHAPDAVLHLAAETHVDRSIDGPERFVRTNAEGTLRLLETVRAWWQRRPDAARSAFRFVHVGTDEVFGSLGATGRFDLDSPYRPRSPYAASKAAADHLVRAWHATYGLPTIVTNGSNTYGPWQLPEKLLPLVLLKALRGEPLPIYGDGRQVREWLHVDDHAEALIAAVARGRPGATYLVGGGEERTNLETVTALCRALDAARPAGAPHARLVRHVEDRLGHDRRYALDARATREALGWRPTRSFEQGLVDLVAWALRERAWLERMAERDGVGTRLGLGARA